MVGRWKANQTCSKSLSERSKEDMISELPDSLICQIFYHLPTKDVVRTSVLSTRWRNLWLLAPSLDLASWEFPNFNAFVSFCDMLLDSNRFLCRHRVKLSIEEYRGCEDGAFYLKSWIDDAVKHKIQHLDVSCPPEFLYEMPQSLYLCETLVSLKLAQVNVVNAVYVSLPCLKTMYLEENWYLNEATFETLVSCCPVLEDLNIDVGWNDTKVYRVYSRSLKRLTFVRVSPFKFDFVKGVVVVAPRLCALSINDHASESFSVNSLETNAKLDISLLFGLRDYDEASILSRRNSIRDFLSGVSRVREMIICPRTFKIIYEYSKQEPLPQFGCMYRLCVTLCVSNLEWLSTFLESFPNLKSLTLDWNGNLKKMCINEMSQISFSSVPKCLLSSLEFVDIKSTILGYAVEMKIARYFLENSAILKKLTLCLHYHAIQDDFGEKLLKIPRRSTTCQVVVVGLEETVENMTCLSLTGVSN